MSATTLGDEFPKQQARLRELVGIYRSLPGGVGAFGALMIEDTLRRADAAAMSGDLVEMLRAYEAMRGIKD